MYSDLSLADFSSTVMPHIGSLAMSVFTSSLYSLSSLRVAELPTTNSELKAMAPAAQMGLIDMPKGTSMPAATGIETVLYMNAQNRFCLIFFIVALLSLM